MSALVVLIVVMVLGLVSFFFVVYNPQVSKSLCLVLCVIILSMSIGCLVHSYSEYCRERQLTAEVRS